MSTENRTLRESIWSVARESAKVYFAVFTALNIMNAARVIWFETTQAQHAGWSPMTDAILDGMGRGALGVASASIAITDTWRMTMVLAGMLEEWMNRRRARQMAEAVAEGEARGEARGRSEGEAEGRVAGRAEGKVAGRAEGRAEGRAATDALWRAWNGRRLDALAKGEPFTEPPPDIAEPSGNGRNGR